MVNVIVMVTRPKGHIHYHYGSLRYHIYHSAYHYHYGVTVIVIEMSSKMEISDTIATIAINIMPPLPSCGNHTLSLR